MPTTTLSPSPTHSHSSDDESAQWVRFTLQKLTHLAISARLVGPGAIDAEGLLCDERLLRDLDYMSSVIAGELIYYTPRVLVVTSTSSTPAPFREDERLLHGDVNRSEQVKGRGSFEKEGKLLHTSDKNVAQQQKKCKIIWTQRGKDGATIRETEMGTYAFLQSNERAITKDEDEHEDAGLRRWELPRRKSRGAEGVGRPVLSEDEEDFCSDL